jgi:hypothetical protein
MENIYTWNALQIQEACTTIINNITLLHFKLSQMLNVDSLPSTLVLMASSPMVEFFVEIHFINF